MNQNISYSFYQTPAGILQVGSNEFGISEAVFVEENRASECVSLDTVKLLISGTDFQKKVWQATLQIPAGKTISYQELAIQIGHPNAHRAVANALGDNKIAYFIPCHRVVRKNGQLGGYRWGLARKIALLAAEQQRS